MSLRTRTALRIAALAALVGLAGAASAQDASMTPQDAVAKMTKAIQEKNDGIRNRMFFELRVLGEPSVAPLIQLLDHKDPEVAGYAAHTLSFLNEADLSASALQSVLDALIAHLHAESPYTRKMCARALGRMEKREALTPLQGMVGDPDAEVRQDVAWALGWIRDPRALPSLEKLKADPNDLVKFFADEAIETIHREEELKKAR